MLSANREIFHIYCDESCHLEGDGKSHMVLGAIVAPAETRHSLARKLAALKREHEIQSSQELKWTKITPSKLAFYLELVDWFFSEPRLRFRAVVVDKSRLDHKRFDNSHDDFYYRIWFILLRHWLEKQACYRIFLDIKDSRSTGKVRKLEEVLRTSLHDNLANHVRSMEQVRSNDVPLLQLADLLIGAVAYANRGLVDSPAKLAIVRRVESHLGQTLTVSTRLAAAKFNLLVWKAS